MKRFSQLKLTKGLILLFVVTAINLVYYAFPVYYYDALHVQAQLSQLQQQPSQQQQKPSPIISVKITSPITGQQVPAGELTISGRSTDNPTTDCTVYADWNNTKPFQKAIATGPGGVNDYSTWNYTYTNNYHLIINGTNNLTSKLTCITDPINLTKWSSIDVIAGGINENEQRGLFSTTTEDDCISYNDVKRLIKISCKFAKLTDIYNQINNHEVLAKEPQQKGIWLLNANLTIDNGSTLTIDPKDTMWLKIITDGKTLAYGIY